VTRLVAEHKLPTGQSLRLIHGDITEEKVDAIVNAANEQLIHGGGLAAAIVRRGGKSIQDESNAWVREHGPISYAQPALTEAGLLPCRYVIHAVGPRWGEGDEDTKLNTAVKTALSMADKRGFKDLALPAISTGIFGFPKERGAEVILGAIIDFYAAHPESALKDIHITLIDSPSVRVFTAAFNARWPESVLQP
jgi:O-acetyl-ADP-ribose deacetylase (regulator of RNase III)